MKPYLIIALFAAVLALTGCTVQPVQPAAEAVVPAATPAPLEWTRCSEQLPADLECAQMQVPMDYAAPGGETITLGLTRMQATDPDKRIGSLESLLKAMQGDASDFAVELKTAPTHLDFSETAIQCLDWPADTNATFAGYQARRIFDTATAPHTQGATQSWRAQTRCIGWPFPPTNPPRPLVVEGAPPILIVNATYDPSTSM